MEKNLKEIYGITQQERQTQSLQFKIPQRKDFRDNNNEHIAFDSKSKENRKHIAEIRIQRVSCDTDSQDNVIETRQCHLNTPQLTSGSEKLYRGRRTCSRSSVSYENEDIDEYNSQSSEYGPEEIPCKPELPPNKTFPFFVDDSSASNFTELKLNENNYFPPIRRYQPHISGKSIPNKCNGKMTNTFEQRKKETFAAKKHPQVNQNETSCETVVGKNSSCAFQFKPENQDKQCKPDDGCKKVMPQTCSEEISSCDQFILEITPEIPVRKALSSGTCKTNSKTCDRKPKKCKDKINENIKQTTFEPKICENKKPEYACGCPEKDNFNVLLSSNMSMLSEVSNAEKSCKLKETNGQSSPDNANSLELELNPCEVATNLCPVANDKISNIETSNMECNPCKTEKNPNKSACEKCPSKEVDFELPKSPSKTKKVEILEKSVLKNGKIDKTRIIEEINTKIKSICSPMKANGGSSDSENPSITNKPPNKCPTKSPAKKDPDECGAKVKVDCKIKKTKDVKACPSENLKTKKAPSSCPPKDKAKKKSQKKKESKTSIGKSAKVKVACKTGAKQECECKAIVRIRDPAPQFTATAVLNGEFKELSLCEYLGQYVVLVFYPLDFSFVCPTELMQFSDRMEEFKCLNTAIIGISCDSQFTHLAFMNTPREEAGIGMLQYPLVSDATGKISKDYGAYYEDLGHAGRITFIISDKGILRHKTENDLRVGRSIDETLRLVEEFQKADKNPCES